MLTSTYEVPLERNFGSAFSITVPQFNTRYDSVVVAVDEFADDNVNNLPRSSRRCKFPDETEGLWAFPYYSYSVCIAQCKVEQKMKLCNCTDKFIGRHQGKC